MFSVVLDTCVLHPTYLRDTLLRLSAAGLYRPLWPADILDELVRNLPESVTPDAAEGLVRAMRDAFPDATVTGYEELVDAMTNDPEDRHVLAAAARADASDASARGRSARRALLPLPAGPGRAILWTSDEELPCRSTRPTWP